MTKHCVLFSIAFFLVSLIAASSQAGASESKTWMVSTPKIIESANQESEWESRWQGTLNNQERFEMNLKKQGSRLSGTVVYYYPSGKSGPYEMQGRLSAD